MYRHSFYPLFFLTILMVAVGQMTQTLYVPSIPMMAGDFHVASGQLQAVMACYLIPYGLSQFVYGSSRDLGEVEVDRQGAGKLAVSKH
ncbi:hypothetical protein ACK3Y9_19210, partial [Aeromonas caviae]